MSLLLIGSPPSTSRPPLKILVVGASVRAAAASLRRAGCRPVAFDLFDDLDLAETCESTRLSAQDYPDGIWDRVRPLDPTPWLYTGSIENYPEVVQAISTRFRLLGNAPEVLRSVRNPFELAEFVRRSGFLAPRVQDTSKDIPTDGSWLVKPVASGGGEGIAPWVGQPLDSIRRGQVYFQERVGGLPLSATFVRDDSTTRLAGVTRQFLGRPGNRFAYRGSLGPWPLPSSTGDSIEGLGRAVGDSFGLLGLFGVDLIFEGNRPWLIEVNPRYSASVEVLEYATGRSIMAEHLRAFGVESEAGIEGPSPRFAAKAILFARSSGRVEETISTEADGRMPLVGDIPRLGTEFEPGQPLLTVFSRGDSVAACRADLAGRVRTWRRRFDKARSGSIKPGC